MAELEQLMGKLLESVKQSKTNCKMKGKNNGNYNDNMLLVMTNRKCP